MTELADRNAIIFDTTLPSVEGARSKIRKCLKLKKKVEVYAVIPDDLRRAFVAFLHRDRKFSDEHFYRTHSGSRKTLLWIATRHPEVTIHIIESSYTRAQELHFEEIEFENDTLRLVF